MQDCILEIEAMELEIMKLTYFEVLSQTLKEVSDLLNYVLQHPPAVFIGNRWIYPQNEGKCYQQSLVKNSKARLL